MDIGLRLCLPNAKLLRKKSCLSGKKCLVSPTGNYIGVYLLQLSWPDDHPLNLRALCQWYQLFQVVELILGIRFQDSLINLCLHPLAPCILFLWLSNLLTALVYSPLLLLFSFHLEVHWQCAAFPRRFPLSPLFALPHPLFAFLIL